MKFTTPCFVCVEDLDKRDALIDWCASIGYDTNKWKVSPKVRYVFCGAYFAGRCGEKALASLPHNSIDCGENVELFKAQAAMNDENDREQWFVTKEVQAWVNQGLYAPMGSFEKCLLEHRVGISARKATVEEIIKHFKKS